MVMIKLCLIADISRGLPIAGVVDPDGNATLEML